MILQVGIVERVEDTQRIVISIAIVEDEREIREGLSILIGESPGFRITAAFPNAEEALGSIGGDLPDVVLMDLGLPGMSGCEAIGALKTRYPGLQFLVLTAFESDKHVFSAMCAGACGYLLKRTPHAQLVAAIAELLEGGAPMTPSIARQVVKLFRTCEPPSKAECRFTRNEAILLKLFVEGHSQKTAAYEMDVSIHTVSFHCRNIFEKLHVHSRSEAVAKALRQRLL